MKMKVDYKIVRMRCFAILVVVFGHSIILYDEQWGVYATQNKVMSLMWIKHFINTFQMPLFLFISGFCFWESVKRHGFDNKKATINGILNKAKHLLIPFVIVALFWMIPIRKLCNYTPWENIPNYRIILYVLLGKDSGHLWFLPTLFIIFVLAFVGLNINCKRKDCLIIVFSFFIMVFAAKFPAYLFISNVAQSMYWFFMGYEFNKYKVKTKFESWMLRRNILTFFIGVILLIVLVESAHNYFLQIIEKIVVSIVILELYNIISNKKPGMLIKVISERSMGIYLLHSPLVYFMYAYYTDANPFIMVFVNFIICGLISLLLSVLFGKIKTRILGARS